MYQSILSVTQGVKEGALLLLLAALHLEDQEDVQHDGSAFLTTKRQQNRYANGFPLPMATFKQVITESYHGMVWLCIFGHILSNVIDCTWFRMTVVFRDRDRAMLLAIVVTVPMTIIG